jgi:putative molybdopterin biosynthesis protein
VDLVKNYSEHVTLAKAWEILKSEFEPLIGGDSVEVPAIDSLGFSLACDVQAVRNVPHFAASAVDGYAVESSLTAGASPATPVTLKKGQYAWVNTGADIPKTANSVLMVEDSSKTGEDLLIYKTLTPYANVRPLGEDVMAGQIIAREKERVTPAHISLFLSAGIEAVPVIRKPKVLFIPTGNEIVSGEEWLTDSAPKSGTAAESNSLFIGSSFKKWGYELNTANVIPDDAELIKKAVVEGTDNYDIVLIGAGSAKGDRDHTLEVLEEAGSVLFHWIKMKPGRPAMAANVRGKPVICMPGFPMSTAVVLWSLVYPLLELYSGRTASQRKLIEDALGTKEIWDTKLLVQHSSPAGIEDWLRVMTAKVGDDLYCWSLTSGASVMLALAESDGIALLPASALEMEKGTEIRVMMTKNVDLDKRILFQGSDDPAIALLATPVQRRGGELVSRAVGSMGGLAALSRGECHVAASHLLDASDGSYNDSFIARFSKGQDWRRILVFYRTQGIIVKKGNPRNIKGFEDLCSGDCVLANRQPGAGTRVLFDYYLQKHGKKATDVVGYNYQCTTHMEAANRVYTGLADAALGIKSAADALGLDFVPLTEEPYELVIPGKYIEHPSVKALIYSLDDAEWREQVEKMGGYRWPN